MYWGRVLGLVSVHSFSRLVNEVFLFVWLSLLPPSSFPMSSSFKLSYCEGGVSEITPTEEYTSGSGCGGGIAVLAVNGIDTKGGEWACNGWDMDGEWGGSGCEIAGGLGGKWL